MLFIKTMKIVEIRNESDLNELLTSSDLLQANCVIIEDQLVSGNKTTGWYDVGGPIPDFDKEIPASNDNLLSIHEKLIRELKSRNIPTKNNTPKSIQNFIKVTIEH